MDYELPKGFSVVSEPNTDNKNVGSQPTFDLPEGFEVVPKKEATKKPMSTLMNPVTEQNPFATSNQPISKEPQLDLWNQQFVEPSLSEAEQQAEEAKRISSKYNNMYAKYSTSGKVVQGMLGDAKAKTEAANEANILKNNLIKELKNQGIDAKYNSDNNLVVIKDGQEVEADSGILQDIWSSKAETGGSVAAAITGARVGAVAGPWGALAGGVVAGVGGAMVGKGIDILINQQEVIQKIDNDLAYQQMKEAGIVDVVGGVVGMGVVKTGMAVGKPIKHIYDRIVNGNIDGAYDYALKHFNVTDAEARELVAKVQEKIGPVAGTDKEQALKVLSITQPGGEEIVQKAAILDPTTSASVANQVFDRARQLKQASSELSADNIHQIVNKNLDNYMSEVQDYYVAVKQAGADFTEGYTFNYEKTGLKPILDEIGSKIEDPRIAQNYANLMQRVGDATESRTFEDLVDLRQLVNEVKYNSGNLSRAQTAKLDLIKNSIDEEITNTAKTYIPSSDTWMDSWSKAKASYSEMKQLEKNVLFNALTKPGINEDQVVKAVSKYMGANTDPMTGINVFNQVMDKLPKNVRSRVDGAVLDTLVEKYSAGTTGGNRAVHFPKLAQEIGKISWKNSTPKVQQLTRTINKLAEVFKNDVNLARVSGGIEIPKFQSYLTVDPIVRIKYEVASSLFNYAKQLAPGDRANALSLLSNANKLLENPLSMRTIKEMYSQMPKDRRYIRERLNFDNTRQALANEYMHRKEILAKIQGTNNIVPRLVWKEPKVAPTNQMPSGDTLYGTQRGTVSTSATKAIMQDRSDDLIANFVQEQVIRNGIAHRIGIQDAAGMYDKFATKIHNHLSDKRLTDIGMNVRKKLKVDEDIANQRMIKKSIEAEANILVRKIEKDFGVKMPQSEADKIVRMKFKELMEKCGQ